MYSFSVLVDFETPEECQQTCQADPACAGFTSVQSKYFCFIYMEAFSFEKILKFSSVRIQPLQIHVLNLKIKPRWTTEISDVIPLACVLFSEIGQETPCQNCVSGQP